MFFINDLMGNGCIKENIRETLYNLKNISCKIKLFGCRDMFCSEQQYVFTSEYSLETRYIGTEGTGTVMSNGSAQGSKVVSIEPNFKTVWSPIFLFSFEWDSVTRESSQHFNWSN